MPQYRRSFLPGGTFFLTIVTERRAPILTTPLARPLLHAAIDACRRARPFTIDALVLLPDHWHILLTLPPGDADYPTRIASIKSTFTRHYLAVGGHEQPCSPSRQEARRRGVWQRHFWEHQIRDHADFESHHDYIHYNPVKHNHAICPHAWPYSTFSRAIATRRYTPDWQCHCSHRTPDPPNFDALPIHHME
jgi:putative transposase